MSDEEKVTLDKANELDLSEGLKDVVPPEPVEEEEESFDPCLVEAFVCLMNFQEAFAEIPEGSKYLSQLRRLNGMINCNRDDIVDELKRAHARGRC